MKSPIGLIREGIENDDMNLVAEGFCLLTGEKNVLKETDKPIDNNTQNKPEKESVTENSGMEDFIAPTRSEDSTGGRARSEPIHLGDRENQWTDDGSIPSEDENNLINDSIKPPVPRIRKKAVKAEVVCNKCGRSYRISPSLKRDFYVCERCVV